MSTGADVPPRPRKRRGLFSVWLEAVLFGLALVLCSLIIVISSPFGTRSAVAIAQHWSQGRWDVARVDGTLWGTLQVSGLRIHLKGLEVSVDRASVKLQPAGFLRGEFEVAHMDINELALEWHPTVGSGHDLDKLLLPVSVELHTLNAGHISFNGKTILTSITLSGRSDGEHHHVDLTRALTPWFAAQGDFRIDGNQPFKLGGEIQLDGRGAGASWRLGSFLSGDLSDLHLRATGRGAPPGIAPFEARFDVHLNALARSSYALLRSGVVESHRIDLHTLAADLPHTALDVNLNAIPDGSTVATTISIHNGMAGAVTASRLPLTDLGSALRLNEEGARIDRLDAHLTSGVVHVTGLASRHQLGLDIALDQLALAQFGGPPWPLSGRLHLDGLPQQPHLSGDATVPGMAATVDASLVREGSVHVVKVNHLRVDGGNGQLDVAGRVSLAGTRSYALSGQMMHFNPGMLDKLVQQRIPGGDVNGEVALSGSLVPLSSQINLVMRESYINGDPFSGKAAWNWQPGHVQSVNIDLALGTNHLRADGAYGRPGETMRIEAAMLDLAALGRDFSGRLEGRVTLAGDPSRPMLEGSARADELRMPAKVSIEHASLRAHLDATPAHPADSPLSLGIDVKGLRFQSLEIASARINLSGTQAGHSADLTAQGTLAGEAFNLLAQGGGTLDMHGWHGQIDRMENLGQWPLQLHGPARLSLAALGGTLDGLDADLLGTQIRLSHGEWQGSRFAAKGEIDQLALSTWLQRVPELHRRLLTDLVLTAHFDLHGDDSLGGNLLLERQRGDISLLADDPTVKPMPLKLSALRTTLDLAGRRGNLALDVKSESFGSAKGQLSTLFEPTESGWRPVAGAALDGRVVAEMPALAWLGPLMGPADQVDGKMSAELTVGGVAESPRWFGKVKIGDFSLRLPEFGANWHHGQLEATLDGETATLAALSLKAGKGEVIAAGRMALHDSGPEGALAVTFNHFGAVTLPERNLTVSGSTNLSMQGDALTLTGKLTADEGRVEVVKITAPVLGDDVSVRGREVKIHPLTKAPPMTLRLDLDLGDHFQFKGQGVDARLSGQLRVSASPSQRPGVVGAVKVEEGRYQAYGQTLMISRGIVTYQGALEDPALDIFAERKNLPIQVGVKISGLASEPKVTLTSDQALPDSEKLAWLVLGHGSNSASGRNDADVLIAAADTLFSAGQSAGIRQQLANTLGLDDISVGRSTGTYTSPINGSDALPSSAAGNNSGVTGLSAATNSSNSNQVAGRVLSLGKRLSEHIYVSYDQSLDGIGNALKLTYQFTHNVSLALTAGQTSSIDLLYSWLFDLDSETDHVVVPDARHGVE